MNSSGVVFEDSVFTTTQKMVYGMLTVGFFILASLVSGSHLKRDTMIVRDDFVQQGRSDGMK